MTLPTPTPPYVVLSGNIASGKSTCARLLSERMGLPLYADADAANPFLALFYEEPARWCFHSQMYFLSESLQQQRSIIANAAGGVLDHSLYEMVEVMSAAMERDGSLSADEFHLIERLYQQVERDLAPPDLLIHLGTLPRQLIDRIRVRNRPFEQSISLSYLELIEELESRFADEWIRSPVFYIDSAAIDVRDPSQLERVACEAAKLIASGR